jgi:hypothetical protein
MLKFATENKLSHRITKLWGAFYHVLQIKYVYRYLVSLEVYFGPLHNLDKFCCDRRIKFEDKLACKNTAIIKVEKLSEGPCADSMRGTCAIHGGE